MSEDELKKEIRQLMMLISNLRSLDNERYEEHVNFTNEVVGFINKIAENMEKNWEKIHSNLQRLNNTIENSLDALLTGINPEGIRETSASLKEVMNTMGRSLQSMNLENVMQELRQLSGHGISLPAQKKGKKSEAIQLGGAPYSQDEDDDDEEDSGEPEVYGYVPGRKEKKKLREPKPLF